MPIVVITQLVKAYGAHRVLDRLNLEIAAGEIVALMGKSGVGKTTLLSCILGFEKPDSGSIEIDGYDVAGVAIEERRLAYVPQDYGLFPHLSVRDNIAFGMTIRKKPHTEIDQRVQELLHTVELPKIILNRGVDRLSGGERQRVALARALAVEPKLFLFDEPLSAVDMETRAEVGAELRAIIKKLAIPAIVVTHDPNDARTLADTIYRLENGVLQKITIKA